MTAGRAVSIRSGTSCSGSDNCGVNVNCDDNNDEPGNQQAGIDARLSLSIFGQNVGLYGQFQAEDGNSDSWEQTSKKRPMAGIDTTFMLGARPVLAFVEYADTLEFCNEANEAQGIGDCFYEHSIYLTGLRYNGRNIGNLYDNDAESWVFGMISQWRNDAYWQWRVRYVDLNRDNSDKFPGQPNGNTVTEIAEDLLMVSGRYERIFGRWKGAVGGSVSRSDFISRSGDTDYTAFLEIEYLF